MIANKKNHKKNDPIEIRPVVTKILQNKNVQVKHPKYLLANIEV